MFVHIFPCILICENSIQAYLLEPAVLMASLLPQTHISIRLGSCQRIWLNLLQGPMTNGNYHFIISLIGRSGWILQLWMIKEEWRVSAFHPPLIRRFSLDIQAFPECAIYTLSPLGSNPGILGKSGKTAGVYSNIRAPAACYIPETRILTSELCTLPEHCWFSTAAVKWRHPPSIMQHKWVATEATESPKGAPWVQAHFPNTWSWLVHFQTAENHVSEQTNGNGWKPQDRVLLREYICFSACFHADSCFAVTI